ncbi:SEC-C metal-binding domain-containing protein [Neomesorhizobium albiziae]|uniref:SEC-C metal-binding domain-containing protein n=1 Tax=Neomesorhizobium albiziae TaxID=335020 RepID=UPI00313D03A3
MLRSWASPITGACRPRNRKNLVTSLHAATRIGRNDPCPCGSGKKFKKCCGGDA